MIDILKTNQGCEGWQNISSNQLIFQSCSILLRYLLQETSVADENIQTASERKIGSSSFFSESLSAKEDMDGFRIVHVSVLKSMLDTLCVCSRCKVGMLRLSEDSKRKIGLSSLLSLECGFCGQQTELHTSPKCTGSNAFEINKRSVLSMIEIGAGRLPWLKSVHVGTCPHQWPRKHITIH